MASFAFNTNTCLKRCLKIGFNINCYKYLSNNSVNIKNKTDIMPKDNSVLIQKLRQNRINNSKKSGNNPLVSNLFQLCVLGNGSKGNPRALYVLTDRNTYLFNCGEGTQRLANEHRFKLAKLENIFITRRCSENFSGVVGLALTCQDIGLPSLTIHGPQYSDKLLRLYETFLTFSGMKIQSNGYIDYKFEDSDFMVKCHPIFKSVPNEDNRQMNKRIKTEANEGIDSQEMSFIYVCKLKARPGELLINKCIELKVPPGPLLGKLKAGEDIVLSDNRVIRSQDVMGPEEKGPVFLVLECPSIQYIESLVNNKSIFESLSVEDMDLVSAIVHFTPSDVMNDRRYEEWMHRFNDSVKHLVMNGENPKQCFVASNRIQIKLNLIDSFVFPLLHCIQTDDEKQENIDSNIVKAKALSKYHLRPSNVRGLDIESAVNINVQGFRDEALNNESFVESLSRYHSLQTNSGENIQEFPEFIFLGTGSAVPSKERATSAVWVNIDSDTSFLLDCGEGTYGQLYRFYGEKCDLYLKQLKGIYVSHLHADHHLGLLQLIKNRSFLTSEPIVLIIPPAVQKWLQNYNECVEKISHLYTTVLCETFLKGSDEKVINCLKLSEIKTVFVPHCSHSYGIAFTTKSNPSFKIVYSGDTQPTTSLTRIGENCDLLIHESTMEDELVSEARLKYHSTTSEAIQMGVNMNAKFTILTHFSQRYSKIPLFNDSFNDRVGIAFDNMRVRISDLNKLPKMIPTLECLFNERIEEMKAKTAQMLKRKELLAEYQSNKSAVNQN